MFEIRAGKQSDVAQIAEIYDHILTEEEKGNAIIGWIRGVYPTAETAQAALDAGELFVLEDEGAVRAAARINRVQVPEYENADWEAKEASEDRVMVLHTLVVEPSAGGRGYGSAFVAFYEQYAREQDCPYLRMDTNQKNQAARRLYAHLGYREAGIVDCSFNGIPDVKLVCLEKTLDT